MAMYSNYAGSCRVNPKTHPVKDKVDLFTATQNIGNWKGLCTNLGASNGIMDRLEFSNDPVIIKMEKCLTDVFNNLSPDWETVVRVVGNHPIKNKNEACEIAEKYIGMEETECRCIITAHERPKEGMKGYETGQAIKDRKFPGPKLYF